MATMHTTSTPGGLRQVGHHPFLAKLIVVGLLALLIAAASRTRLLLWPLLIYGWAAATTGGLLLLWRVERHNTPTAATSWPPQRVTDAIPRPAVPAPTYDTSRSVKYLPEYISQLRFAQARYLELAAKVRQQLQHGGNERDRRRRPAPRRARPAPAPRRRPGPRGALGGTGLWKFGGASPR